MPELLYDLQHIIKTYPDGEKKAFEVLNIPAFQCYKGEFLAITGESGSGKTTLLNVLGLLDGFQQGDFYFEGESVQSLSEKQKAAIRSRKIGFILQNFGLIDDFTVRENILVPSQYLPRKQRLDCQKQLPQLLEELSLTPLLKKYPKQLSGGQKQRVAIARALLNQPEVILADEPTGNLDSKNSQQVMALLSRQHQLGRTVLLVTHNHNLAQECQRILTLADGRILKSTPVSLD